MATKPNTPPAKAGKTVPGLRVRSCSPQDIFRRAGHAFSRLPTEIPLSDLDKDQVKRLREEPMLLVEDIEIPVAEAEEPADT